MNKKGCVFTYQRSIRLSKLCYKKTKAQLKVNSHYDLLKDREFGDVVIKAGPPKKLEEIDNEVNSIPVKFTIPNCSNNANFIEQVNYNIGY